MSRLSDVRELVGIAAHWSRARPLRFALMASGAALGVGIVVASQGALLSAKSDLTSELESIGTNLVVVEASESPDGRALDEGSKHRVDSLPGVEASGAGTMVDGAPAVSPRVSGYELQDLSTPVWAVSDDLISVLAARVDAGRSLTLVDNKEGLRATVLGSTIARQLGIEAPFGRTIWLGDRSFGVVGVLEPVALAPEFDVAVLIPESTAAGLFGESRGLDRIYARLSPDQMDETIRAIPLAATQGNGPAPTVRVASALLEAQALIDTSLRDLYLGIGALALFIGAFAIFSTMQLSMLERRGEIGVQRAIGYQRWHVGTEFVLEGIFAGLLGSVVGLIGGMAFVVILAYRRHWGLDLDPMTALAAVGAAVAVSSIAGGLIAVRAAKLEPVTSLRG